MVKLPVFCAMFYLLSNSFIYFLFLLFSDCFPPFPCWPKLMVEGEERKRSRVSVALLYDLFLFIFFFKKKNNLRCFAI